MPKYRPEPSPPAGAAARTGVLLCNLGTPDAPDAPALRRYLTEFLSDPRAIELPRLLWQPLLHGVILRKRPAQSAEKYRSIWREDGSPLLVWGEKQRALLAGYLGERGLRVQVGLAMRYGNPSIASQLDALKAAGCARILVLPLYPQYAAATVGSVMDQVAAWVQGTRVVPALRSVRDYATEPGYIQALAAVAQATWQASGRPDHLVMSFHGLPQRMVDLGDPYRDQCSATAQTLAAALGLQPAEWTLAFQSRFGRAQWLTPSTQDVLQELGKARTAHLGVICPGFTSDCLETLEEIDIEGRALFTEAGGGRYDYIPCMNDHPTWIGALADLAQRHLQGWTEAAA